VVVAVRCLTLGKHSTSGEIRLTNLRPGCPIGIQGCRPLVSQRSREQRPGMPGKTQHGTRDPGAMPVCHPVARAGAKGRARARARANGVAQHERFGKVFISCRRKRAGRRPRQHAYHHQKTAAAINQSSFSCPSGAPTALPTGLPMGYQSRTLDQIPSPGLVYPGRLPRLPSQAPMTQVRYLNKDTVLAQ
jgi:hypothetical protein